MALKRIYGDFQTAGVSVVTTGKSNVSGDGLDGFAQAVVLVDATGAVIGNSTALNIATNATNNAIKTGAGAVTGLSINTAGTTSTLVLYDSLTATGTKLGTFTTTAQGYLPLDIPFTTGLTAVTAGGAAADITLAYR
jgi:hypothetical protein